MHLSGYEIYQALAARVVYRALDEIRGSGKKVRFAGRRLYLQSQMAEA